MEAGSDGEMKEAGEGVSKNAGGREQRRWWACGWNTRMRARLVTGWAETGLRVGAVEAPVPVLLPAPLLPAHMGSPPNSLPLD